MSQGRDIKELIQAIAGEDNSVVEGLFFVAEVKSATDESCTIDLDGLELSDVRTGAVIDDNTSNLRIKPKVGSKVLVCDMSGNFTQLFVVAFSEVDSITINGGSLGGLVNIERLNENLDKIKQYIDDLQTLSATAMTPMAALDEGASVTAYNASWLTKKQSFAFKDMEDTKIKH